MILMWVFPEPHTFWETVPLYWHNWLLPFFKHFLWLLWYNIFFWFCELSESVILHRLLPSPARISGPRFCPPPSPPSAVCPHEPIHLQHSNSGRWFPTQPFWCQPPGESHGAAWNDFGTAMNYFPGSGQNGEADDTSNWVPPHPTSPLGLSSCP